MNIGCKSFEERRKMSRPIRVALISATSERTGGGHTFEKSFREAVVSCVSLKGWELKEYWARSSEAFIALGNSPQGDSPRIREEALAQAIRGPLRRLQRLSKKPHGLNSQLISDEIDLAVFASHGRSVSSVRDIPFTTVVWDLGHRDLPEFPEFRGREWSAREAGLQENLPRAFHIFTDSISTGERIEQIYHVDSSRWSSIGLLHNPRIFPGQPSHRIREIAASPFFFYPANHWPHKNHKTIIEAFSRVIKKVPLAKLVLSGNHQHGLPAIIRFSQQFQVEDSIIDLGFIPEADVDFLVRHAVALVMPTLLGPTNLPPLHANAVGTPVIQSDSHISTSTEQAGITTIPALDTTRWEFEMLRHLKTRPVFPPPAQVTDPTRLLDEVFSRFEQVRRLWE